MKNICVITGTRAEYGILSTLIGLIKDSEFELKLLVTGAHLSKDFGETYQEIEKDGFEIDEKLDIELNQEGTQQSTCHSMAIAIEKFGSFFARAKLNLLIVLGDRYEVHSAVTAAMIYKIPVAHIHGGEITEGAVDELMRHSITKMSILHFTAAEEYRNRVIQMGERPGAVFNVGAPGLDKIKNLKLLSQSELERSLGVNLNEVILLFTYHPITMANEDASKSLSAVVEAMSMVSNKTVIMTMPNADHGNKEIRDFIQGHCEKHEDFHAFESLGQQRYLSALKHCHFVIGNSSSGIIEAPFLKVPTINIGDRQKGRIRARSVIDCSPTFESIKNAIDKVISKDFRKNVQNQAQIFGNGESSKKIFEIIKNTDLDRLVPKAFFDIEYQK